MAVSEEYKHVALFWGSTFLAVLLAAVLRAWHVRRALKPQPLPPKKASRIRRLFSCPIPPHDVFEERAGGLCLGELLLACGWLVLVAWFLWGTLGPKLASLAGKEGPQWVNAVIVGRQKAVAKSLGTSMRAQLLLLLYPVQRSSLLAWLFGTYHASIIKYHRWMGWALMATITAHGFLYSLVWFSLGQVIEKGFMDMKNFAGIVAALFALCIASTSNLWFRRSCYQAFWLVHVLTAPLFFTAVIVHDHDFVYHAMPGVLLYVLDRAFRSWQHCTNMTHVCVADGGVCVRGGVVTLRTLWSEGGPHGVRAGQTVYVSIPKLSLFQTHPFSIADVQDARLATALQTGSEVVPASNGIANGRQQLGLGAASGNAADEEGLEDVFDSSMLASQEGPGGAANRVVVVTLHIRATGEWTRRLRNHALEHPDQPMQIQVEGPYDTEVSDDLLRLTPVLRAADTQAPWSGFQGFSVGSSQWKQGGQTGGPGPLVMLSGGIGITPLLGVLKCLARSTTPTPSQQHHSSHHHTQPTHDHQSHHQHQQQWKEIELGPPPSHSPLKLREDSLSYEPSPTKDRGEMVHEQGVAHGVCALPHVYLVYCCRRLEELQLLDTQLLDAAVSPNSWLHLHICYTGYELENQVSALQDSGRPCEVITIASPAELPIFPQGAPPRLLYPSLGRQPFLNAAHTAVMYVGAALGGLVLPATVSKLLYRAHLQQPGELGAGLLVALPLGLGAFLFPLLLLSIIDASRRVRQHTSPGPSSSCSPRCWQWFSSWLRRGSHHAYAYTSASTDVEDQGGREDVGLLHAAGTLAGSQQYSGSAEQDGSQPNKVQVLPGYILAWGAHLEHRLPLHRGRPDLRELLGCVRGTEQHASKQQQQRTHGAPSHSKPGRHSVAHSTPISSHPHSQGHVGVSSSTNTSGGEEGEITSCADVEAGRAWEAKGAQDDRLALFTGLGEGSTQEAGHLARPQQLVRVYVGGPEPLWKSAHRTCERLNREGGPEAAVFEAVRVAHVY